MRAAGSGVVGTAIAAITVIGFATASAGSSGALWLAADNPVTPKWDGIIPTTLWWVKPRR